MGSLRLGIEKSKDLGSAKAEAHVTKVSTPYVVIHAFDSIVPRTQSVSQAMIRASLAQVALSYIRNLPWQSLLGCLTWLTLVNPGPPSNEERGFNSG
mmetsp:Transcript_4017/g.7735  ORF Transcript_4017/g.7735 Transcript_4017/m.7735 type:complete len:97 (-) Transcript_4017:200-490(-)|eukprot:CAMPEP_0184690398 /NCGR_PEP_ID=MMETSP0312-20130426/31205_1 /TAXON_ID=31354 /ORGANISM="Compsopogon coeruleus, Strain SAG 36.94" /LENGTH=96 /DNA_ID=CAMNT_0027147889 /DNA_START=2031 /DNA_END=2321 /DNA_ORIENTATION=+